VCRKGFNWFIQEVLTQLSADVHYIVIGPKVERSRIHEVWRAILSKGILRQIDLFFGFKSAQGTLEQLIDTHQQGANWPSDLNYHELQYVLSQATLMVMPNITVKGDAEGFGLVSLEANMHGLYVLAADVDSIPSAVHDGHNGSLIAAGDPEQWVAEINAFLEMSDEDIQEKGRSAQSYVQSTFSWPKMAAEYREFFKRITGEQSISL
jgi:glycosyltransferase involved in cell wall biosynthesis